VPGTYEFADARGKVVELVLEPSEAPRIGDPLVVDGRTLTRIASLPEVKKPKDFFHVAHSLHRWHPDAPRHTAEGKPVFCTKREIENFRAKDEARTQGKRQLAFDPS